MTETASFDLTGRTALITGSSRGLGKSIMTWPNNRPGLVDNTITLSDIITASTML